MASNNSRDVRLGLAIDVSGDDDVDALSGSLRGLGTAGAALPAAFTETAAAIGKTTRASDINLKQRWIEACRWRSA